MTTVGTLECRLFLIFMGITVLRSGLIDFSFRREVKEVMGFCWGDPNELRRRGAQVFFGHTYTPASYQQSADSNDAGVDHAA